MATFRKINLDLYVYEKLLEKLSRSYRKQFTINDLKREAFNFRLDKKDVYLIIKDLERLGVIKRNKNTLELI